MAEERAEGARRSWVAAPRPNGGAGSPSRRTGRRLGVLLGILGAGALACSEPELPPGAETRPLPVVEVTTAPVARGAIRQQISAPGSLAALRESRIGAEVRGRLERIFVSEGDRIEAGAPLFQIDPAPYEMAVRNARAGADLARAERRQMESDLARARALLKKDVVAEQKIEQLETTVAVARARERQAREAVELARLELERTLVKAPYAGAVAERLADEGTTALVQPQTIVVVLQETAELEGRATIPETHLHAVRVGDPARLHVEGLPEAIEARVSAVGDVVDPATRTYEVKMRVPNPDHRLKAGVFAQVEITPAPKAGVLVVPREALRTEEGRTRVLTVEEGRVAAIPLQVGIVTPDVAEVLAGLAEGQRVIVGEEAQTLAPGMRVRVRAEDARAS